MKAILHIWTLAAVLCASAALFAQGPAPAAGSRSLQAVPPRQQKFFYHYEWTRGVVLTPQEWKRGTKIAHPGRHGLKPAPVGDEWREIDRNYVLASRARHAIVSVVAAPHPTVPGNSGGGP